MRWRGIEIKKEGSELQKGGGEKQNGEAVNELRKERELKLKMRREVPKFTHPFSLSSFSFHSSFIPLKFLHPPIISAHKLELRVSKLFFMSY